MQQQTNDPNDHSDGVSLTPQQREQMIAKNVASIEAVPLSVWESSCADGSGLARRQWALHWARRGYDVYCYSPIGAPGQPRRYNLCFENRRIELGREGSAE